MSSERTTAGALLGAGVDGEDEVWQGVCGEVELLWLSGAFRSHGHAAIVRCRGFFFLFFRLLPRQRRQPRLLPHLIISPRGPYCLQSHPLRGLSIVLWFLVCSVASPPKVLVSDTRFWLVSPFGRRESVYSVENLDCVTLHIIYRLWWDEGSLLSVCTMLSTVPGLRNPPCSPSFGHRSRRFVPSSSRRRIISTDAPIIYVMYTGLY